MNMVGFLLIEPVLILAKAVDIVKLKIFTTAKHLFNYFMMDQDVLSMNNIVY